MRWYALREGRELALRRAQPDCLPHSGSGGRGGYDGDQRDRDEARVGDSEAARIPGGLGVIDASGARLATAQPAKSGAATVTGEEAQVSLGA